METIAAESRKSLPASKNLLKQTTDLPALTGLRFFAAIYVVFYHFVFPSLHTGISPLRNVLSAGFSAVGFFFVLSGFVLTYSYLAPGRRSIDRPSFWKARLSRIYPAYFFAFLLAAPFQIWGSYHVNGLRVAAEKLTLGAGLYLTLLQSWTPWTAWYWNIPAWSLSVEVFFYFCFPFAAIVLYRLRARTCLKVAGALWLAGLIVPAIYCTLRPVAAQPPFPMAQLAIETNPLMRLPEFLVGMLIGKIFISGFRLNQRLASILPSAALVVLALLVTFWWTMPRLLLSNGLLAPFSALLIFALAHQSGLLARFLSLPLLKVLGEASYAIYILQFPVSYLLKLTPGTFSVLRFLVYLVALILLSVFTFFYIERPLRHRLRSIGNRKAQNQTDERDVAQLTPQFAVEA